MQGEGEEAGGVGRPVRQGCVPTGCLAGGERAVLLGSSGGWCPGVRGSQAWVDLPSQCVQTRR